MYSVCLISILTFFLGIYRYRTNKQSSLSFMKDILPSYFGSEWSFAQFHIQASKSICCFGADRFTIVGTSQNCLKESNV